MIITHVSEAFGRDRVFWEMTIMMEAPCKAEWDWPFEVYSPKLLLMMRSYRYSVLIRASKASMRLWSSLSTYAKHTVNAWYIMSLHDRKAGRVVKNILLSHNSRENMVLTMGFKTHKNVKNGPPVDSDKLTINAIWVVTAKSCMRNLMIDVNESHAASAPTSCLLPASIRDEY